MKKGVALGPNEITVEILSRAMSNIKTFLLAMFNRYFKEGKFPGIWKKDRLVLIKKIGKPEHKPFS